MSDLSRIDERLAQVVELLRCLVSEVREVRRGAEEERHEKRTRCNNPIARPHAEARSADSVHADVGTEVTP